MRTSGRIAFVLAAVALVSVAVQQAVARDFRLPALSPSFSIVVDASERGIAVDCEEGCRWERVTATYPGDRYRITEEGIESAWGWSDGERALDELGTPGFAIIVTRTAEGVRATCAHGCAWNAVSGASPTWRFQITSRGIVSGR